MKKLIQRLKCWLRIHPEAEQEAGPGRQGLWHYKIPYRCKLCGREWVEKISPRRPFGG